MEGFLMVQTQASAIGAAYEAIREFNGIVQIDRTAGPYDLVALVRGLTDQTTAATLERVRSLQGVLRVLFAPRVVVDAAQETPSLRG